MSRQPGSRFRVVIAWPCSLAGQRIPGETRSARTAALVAEGFNREMRARKGRYSAVVKPMERIKNPPRACQKSALDGSPPREYF